LFGDFDEQKSIIKNPVVMIPVNKEQIAFQPWLPYSEDKDYKLKPDHVLIIATAAEAISTEYNRIYGSGIVVPSDAGGLIS
tara:strand:+ start:340 stop:582 length:243 start_codon:yes stop_codon:yes gene_type:complete